MTHNEEHHIRITMKAKNNILLSEREKRGFSQIQMARFIGINQTTYYFAESLKYKHVSKNALSKIANALEMSTDHIFPAWLIENGEIMSMGEKYLLFSDEHAVRMLENKEPASNEGMDHLLQESLKTDIIKSMCHLTPREKEVVKRRIGLNGYEPHTYKDIGNVLGLSTAHTQHIYKKAIRRLQYGKRAELLRKYVG